MAIVTRRAVLLSMTLAGCSFAPDWGSNFFDFSSADSTSAAGAGCGGPPSLGAFQYVCPTQEAAGDAGTLDASPFAVSFGPASDPACEFGAISRTGAVPTVAVGEPFQLEYLGGASADASAMTLPVAPAVTTMVRTAGAGWLLPQAGYQAFLALEGPEVVDFTHVLAEDIASLGLYSDLPGGPGIGAGADLGPITYSATVGAAGHVLAYPQSDGGGLLGGSLACTFVSSDPSLLSVTGQGVVALLTPLESGNPTLTVACAGFQVGATVHIEGAPQDLDDGASDAAADADASADAADPDDAEAPVDAGAPVDGEAVQ